VFALASARPTQTTPVIFRTFAAFALSLAAFALSRSYWLSLILLVATAGTMNASMSATNTALQSSVPDALRGRIMSLYILASWGTAPVGGLLVGSLASAVGAQIAVFVGAVVCALSALAFWRYRPSPAGAVEAERAHA
jgi:MFS family permease